MIKDDNRVNNEFYVAPVYNYILIKNKKLGVFNIGEVFNGMYGMGIPSDLDRFEKSSISHKAVLFK